jgi:hypothetical protein
MIGANRLPHRETASLDVTRDRFHAAWPYTAKPGKATIRRCRLSQ